MLLNARPENAEREGEVVAQAGRLAAVTVATNMAGRGTDILLGGSAKGLSRALAKQMLLVRLGVMQVPTAAAAATVEMTEEVTTAGELAADNDNVSSPPDSVNNPPAHVHEQEDENVENQDDDEVEKEEVETDPDVLALPSLAALAAHMGLSLPRAPSGNNKRVELDLQRAVVSCSDDLLQQTESGSERVANMAKLSEADWRLVAEDVISQASDSSSPITTARTDTPDVDNVGVVGAVSTPSLRLLRTALRRLEAHFEVVLAPEREAVRRLGGLYVVGTVRHLSRRIDNQLRGRSGRQGDLGASRFFLSLEDDMFRVFGADKMAGECGCCCCGCLNWMVDIVWSPTTVVQKSLNPL